MAVRTLKGLFDTLSQYNSCIFLLGAVIFFSEKSVYFVTVRASPNPHTFVAVRIYPDAFKKKNLRSGYRIVSLTP